MPSFNRVILLGQLLARPELRFTQAGNAHADFKLVVSDRHKTAEGEVREGKSTFHVSTFGKQAEVICAYCDKGSSILVEGRLVEGVETGKVKVVMRRFQFVGATQAKGDPDDEPW